MTSDVDYNVYVHYIVLLLKKVKVGWAFLKIYQSSEID